MLDWESGIHIFRLLIVCAVLIGAGVTIMAYLWVDMNRRGEKGVKCAGSTGQDFSVRRSSRPPSS